MRTWLTVLSLIYAGCGGESSPAEPPGADAFDGTRDAEPPDSILGQDAAPPDVNAIPEPVPEIHLPDLLVDTAAPDAAAPDGPVPDVGVDATPDAGPPDTGAPDLGADGPADAAVADLGADGAMPPCTQVMGTPPLGLQVVETGFIDPSDIQAPPNDPRLFIVEQRGFIWIIDGGSTLPTAFLDLSAVITSPRGNEQGLLGLAFHPNYAANRRFFVYYTDDTGGDIQVSEFAASVMDPNVADPTETPIINILHTEASNHNGGQLAFGPNDGFLYLAVGDGGNSCDTPTGDAQSTMSLLGKVLRLDVDSASPYAIPMDNPFAGSLSDANEIWAYGLRNPWRMSFDRANGDLYIGDVGQDQFEEIDVQPAASTGGENYGWVEWEASVCQDGMGTSCNSVISCTTPGVIFPTHEYPHALSANCFGVAGSVTGGYVYRGCEMPGYHGTYFYADYCLGTVHSFVYVPGMGATNLTDWPSLDAAISTFGQDALGELYVAEHSVGTIYRIVPQ